MERRVYEASLSGNTQVLNTLIKEDPLVVDRLFTLTSFNETPLHIAALRGHLDFTRALLTLNPKLATELDSLGRSPLHLASSQGYTDIVRELLLRASTDVCLVRDHQHGRIPLHLAAMKGRVEVIDELVRARPESTRVKLLDNGETVLHLCVKYNQLGALKKLIESAREEEDELIGSVDDDGNTILHVATALKQIETIKYLLSRRGVIEKANAKNCNGFTALDVLEHLQGMEIRQLLLEFGVRRANDNLKPLAPPQRIEETTDHPSPPPPQSYYCILRRLVLTLLNYNNPNWLEASRGNLMVTATVIATIAFQAGVNPPGGFWQDAKEIEVAGRNITTGIGTSVLGDRCTGGYTNFIIYNTISFVASLSIILFMVSGLSLNSKFSLWILIVTMSIAVSFMGRTYLTVLDLTTPNTAWDVVDNIFWVSLYILFGVSGILVLIHAAHLMRFIIKVGKKFISVFRWILKWLHKLLPKCRFLLPTTTTTSSTN